MTVAASESHPPASISDPGPSAPRALLLAGPTAVGKSEVALLLAEKLGGEIVSADSMQVYRGLEIGTAKPSAEERARVPHHLIDAVEITEPFDVGRFVQLAGRAVAEIQARGRVPILCGGTGLYFKAFLEGLGRMPPADAALRAQLKATPLSELLDELARRDPVTYEHIDRQNARRIIRAIEVIRLTGKPFSAQRAPWQSPSLSPRPSALLIGLARSAGDLRQRIDARVDEMFRRGLVAETEGLLKRGLAQNEIAMQALGYRQVVEHLSGERPLAETIELVKTRTHQYAKRQMTWFRRQLPLAWIQIEPGQTAGTIVENPLFPPHAAW
jgi:tRNA dimethylallyltransferase